MKPVRYGRMKTGDVTASYESDVSAGRKFQNAG